MWQFGSVHALRTRRSSLRTADDRITQWQYVLTSIYFRPALCFILVYNCGLTVRNKWICYGCCFAAEHGILFTCNFAGRTNKVRGEAVQELERKETGGRTRPSLLPSSPTRAVIITELRLSFPAEHQRASDVRRMRLRASCGPRNATLRVTWFDRLCHSRVWFFSSFVTAISGTWLVGVVFNAPLDTV